MKFNQGILRPSLGSTGTGPFDLPQEFPVEVPVGTFNGVRLHQRAIDDGILLYLSYPETGDDGSCVTVGVCVIDHTVSIKAKLQEHDEVIRLVNSRGDAALLLMAEQIRDTVLRHWSGETSFNTGEVVSKAVMVVDSFDSANTNNAIQDASYRGHLLMGAINELRDELNRGEKRTTLTRDQI